MPLKQFVRGKFIALSGYIRKKRSQINDQSFYFKELEESELKPKQAEDR